MKSKARITLEAELNELKAIPPEYRNCITVNDIGNYEVWDETQSGLLGMFKELWKAILCIENYCNNVSQWEKMFKDEINLGGSTEGAVFPYLKNNEWEEIFKKYLEVIYEGVPVKVKIKLRKGAMLIERIK